jgi:membrane associated rhomboid family serine protease
MQYILTWMIILLTTAISVVGFTYRKVYFACIFHPYSYFKIKHWHSVLSSNLVHFSLFDLIQNVTLLYIFGRELERLLIINYFSELHFIGIYIASIMGGKLLSYLIFNNDISFSSVGASNGVFGVIGATLLMEPHKIISFIPSIAIENFYVIPIIWIINLIRLKLKKNEVDYFGHIGGLLTGGCWIYVLNL